ncbi:MAG: NYN domain-containing protein [Candidatus Methylomirabilis sp.]|nr:NYN domain-containing protein [Deltaproteobacteria bacterium]
MKAMIFIDGTWLYRNLPKLAERVGTSSFRVHYGKLPKILAKRVSDQLDGAPIDVVRTNLYGSYADNTHPEDQPLSEAQIVFFQTLKEKFHYEVEVFPIDFQGERVRLEPGAEPTPVARRPKEKCVDVALATSMVYYACQPQTYDVAIAVVGDQDFTPALQLVRRLGKRVAIASIHGACSAELFDPKDPGRLKDFGLIWLDDIAQELGLAPPRPASAESTALGAELAGKIKYVRQDRGFGFIEAEDGDDYFFHLTDLQGDLRIALMEPGDPVVFEVKTLRSGDQAGAARAVRRASG